MPDGLNTRLPDLAMIDENLKVINKLAKLNLLNAEQATEARKLQGTCALLYLTVLTQQVQIVQEKLRQGIAEINAKAKAAEKSFLASAKGDEKTDAVDSVRE